MLINLQNYGRYACIAQNQQCIIDVENELRDPNILIQHYNWILNIMRDGIELEEVQRTFIKIVFPSYNVDCELSLIDYYFNLIMWNSIVSSGQIIKPKNIFFSEYIRQFHIKEFFDNFVIYPTRKNIPIRQLNNILDDTNFLFSSIENFAFYLADAFNIDDDIAMMKACPRFRELINAKLSGLPMDKVKIQGMENTNEIMDLILHSRDYIGYDHYLTNAIRAQQGIDKKQFKESYTNIGPKPNGTGGLYPTIIDSNYINEGLRSLTEIFEESATGRLAQIIKKGNTSKSGFFSMLLGLNNMDIFLHPDPNYICDSKNFEEIYVNEKNLNRLIGRYYRLNPNGVETVINPNDNFLVGQKIYLRSPMTCACNNNQSIRHICYRCYGDLAYSNRSINIGRIAAEMLTAKLTQTQLSAKHIVEAIIAEINWAPDFDELFDLDGTDIVLKHSDDKRKYKDCILVIDSNEICSDNDDYDKSDNGEILSDDMINYDEYITEFNVISANKTYTISANNYGLNLYISMELNEIIKKYGYIEDDKIMVDFKYLYNIPIFIINLKNSGLSEVMEEIQNILDKVPITEKLDRNSALQTLLDTTIKGNIYIASTHLEILLANQLRAVDDILEFPNWEQEHEPSQLLTLKKSLLNSPYIMVSLMYGNLKTSLYTPMSFRKRKPSIIDPFFMVNPQKFLYGGESINSNANKKEDNHPIELFIPCGTESSYEEDDGEE